MTTYPSDQGQPAAALPVRLVNAGGSAFYTSSGGGGGGAPYAATPKGYGQLALTTTAALISTVSGGIPSGATYAVITVEGTGPDTRWRDDGVAPTATVGMPLFAGQTWTFSGDLSTVQFVAVSGTPSINISFYE